MNLEDWFYLIRMGYTQVELPRKRMLPFDPLQYQTEHLIKCMKEKGIMESQVIEEYPPSRFLKSCGSELNHSNISDTFVPNENCSVSSKSSSAAIYGNGGEFRNDYRIHYSYLMLYFLKKIAEELEKARNMTNNPSTILSVNHIAVIEKAFGFIIPTAIQPYVDEGVMSHSTKINLVKHWKPLLEDLNFRKEQLNNALDIFNALMNGCEAVQICVVRKYLADYICLNEQLIALGEKQLRNNYENFLLKIDRPRLMTSLFVLLTASKNQPKWLQRALSSRITKLLLMPNGLHHLITAITEGTNCFGDFGFVQSLSRILVQVPRGVGKEKYYDFLIENLLDVMECHPSASDAAVCFAVVLDILPKEWSEKLLNKLLQPWEYLLVDRYPQIGIDCYNRALDTSLKILSLYTKALPPKMYLPFFSRFKMLFSLWTLLYGSYLENKEETKNSVDYTNVGEGIFSILYRILHDPSFESVDAEAEFLVHQIESIHLLYLLELRHKKILVEVVDHQSANLTSNDELHNHISKPSRLHYGNIEIVLVEPDEPKDVFIRFEKTILKILQEMQKHSPNSACCLVIKTAVRCIERWAKMDSDVNHTARSFCETLNKENNFEEGRQKVNFFLSDLLSILLEDDTVSDENLGNLVGIPLSILDVTLVKLNNYLNMVTVDIKGKASEIDLLLESTVQNNVHLALTILYCILLCKQEAIKKFGECLQRGANILQAFLNTVSQLNGTDGKPYFEFLQKARKILSLLKEINVEPTDEHQSSGFTDYPRSTGSSKAQYKEIFSLAEIRNELSDDSQCVRGHALIMLARGIQKKDKQLLDQVSNYPEIMVEVMKHVADDDSYVYLAAINAMTELAYWKQQFFEAMVEFFLDPTEKLKSIINTSMDCFGEEEKASYLIIQRVKIGEAITKASKKLGQMAPAYFDRMINPLLSLMLHTKDDQLRASVLSSLSELVISCQGLNIHKNLNEMLQAAKMYMHGKEQEIVRRAAINFMRAIVRTYDISLLQEIPFHLHDIVEQLNYILDRDEDPTVKIHAMLCLEDIDTQLKESFLEFENAHMRRIRL